MRPSRPSALLPLLCLPLVMTAGCEDLVNNLAGADCPAFASQYGERIEGHSVLLETIPAEAENFPMGLVINTRALNYLFAKLSDSNLPELTESFNVLGQRITLKLAPSIPLLQIGGNQSCPECLTAAVPFGVGVGINNPNPPLGAGTMRVQMPVGMVPVDNRRTSLVADFSGLTVLGIDVDVPGNLPANILSEAERIASNALGTFLRNRFQSARIATFDSWALGRGDVLLAGRGPFLYPEQGTMLIAMQSNLPLAESPSLEVTTALPAGADFGFVFHPSLLLSLTQRMNWEGVVANGVDDAGDAVANADAASNRVTLETMGLSADQSLLRVGATLWRTSSFCGTADLAASMGLTIEADRFAFRVTDVQITGGEGFGSLISQDNWATGSFIRSLTQTLDITINYDAFVGGEAEAEPEMGPLQFNIDGRGITLYLNLLNVPAE